MEKILKLLLAISLLFAISGCSLWTTDAPTDMHDEQESVVKTLSKSCKKGNAISCSNLAYMYEKGQGVSKNSSKANILYKKACNLGDNSSCHKVGK